MCAGPFRCRALGGGVSNQVILAESPGGMRFVMKQALPQLRVADEWLAERDRIFREHDAMAVAAGLLPRGWVPSIEWSHDEAFIFAMEALPEDGRSWKDALLAGELSTEWGRRAGLALALTVRGSWRDEALTGRFGDQTAFDQLRTDPYYRTVGRRHPDIAQAVDDWIGEIEPLRLALTHGDWSPKNMFLAGARMAFLDYECAHMGDPAYDLAFVLNHLTLKAVHRPERAADLRRLADVTVAWSLGSLPAEALHGFERRTARHLSLLMLARIDGKSPVEYLTDEDVRDRVRRTAKRLIAERPADLDSALRGAWAAVG